MALGLRKDRLEPLTENDLAYKIHRQAGTLLKTLSVAHELGMRGDVKHSPYYPDGLLDVLDKELHYWEERLDGRPD